MMTVTQEFVVAGQFTDTPHKMRVLYVTGHRIVEIWPDKGIALDKLSENEFDMLSILDGPIFDADYKTSPEREAIEYIERLTYHAII